MSQGLINKYCMLLAVTLWSYGYVAQAQFFTHANIGDVSASGRSITLSLGMVEGMRVGLKASFYHDEGRLDYLGTAEVVKTNDNNSFWFFRELPGLAKIRPGQKVFFSIEEEVVRGRRPLKILQQAKVKARDREQSNQDLPDDLIKIEDQFIAGEAGVSTEMTKEHDLKTEDTTTWSGGDIPLILEEYSGELESVRPKDGPQLLDSSEIRAAEQEKTFKAVSASSVEKVRQARQRNSDGAVVGRAHNPQDLVSSIPNEFEKYQDKLTDQGILAKETQARIARNGDLWSAGLSDQELRRSIVESGVLEERERRRKAATNLASHHINLRFTSAIATRATETDPNNNGQSYAMALGYEYMLEHASASLANWSLEGMFERGIDYQDLGGDNINGRIAWGAFGLQMHWFPFYKPSAVRRFIPFVGAGFRRGNGDLQAGSLTQSYDIQMLSTHAHAGLRYRFSAGDEMDNTSRIGMGFFIMTTFENTRFNTTTGLQDNIETVYNFTEQRLSLGISAFF